MMSNLSVLLDILTR